MKDSCFVNNMNPQDSYLQYMWKPVSSFLPVLMVSSGYSYVVASMARYLSKALLLVLAGILLGQ